MEKIIIIAGPTASGKTDLAIKLAKKIDAEIINADSRQIFKEISIGTAKPADLGGIPHHGFDLISIKNEFNVAKFLKFFEKTANDIISRGKKVILTGGTGLYIDACINGLSEIPEIDPKIRLEIAKIPLPELYEKLKKVDPETKVDSQNPQRVIRAYEVFLGTGKNLSTWHKKTKKRKPEYEVELLLLNPAREILYERINNRVDWMFENGLIEETKKLDAEDIKKAGIGYNHVASFLAGEITLHEAKEKMKKDTRNYAKRQVTWFRKYDYKYSENILQ